MKFTQLMSFITENDILFVWLTLLLIAIVAFFFMSKSDRRRNG